MKLIYFIEIISSSLNFRIGLISTLIILCLTSAFFESNAQNLYNQYADPEAPFDNTKLFEDSLLNGFLQIEDATSAVNTNSKIKNHIFNHKISLYKKIILVDQRQYKKDSFDFIAPVELIEDNFESKSKDKTFDIDNFSFFSTLKIINCYCKGYITFENSNFKGNVNIYNNQNYKNNNSDLKCDFDNCYFGNGICFNSQIISTNDDGSKSYDGNNFKKGLYFNDCKIGETLDLSFCSFDSTGSLNFSGNNLIDYIDLSYLKTFSVIQLPSIKPLNAKLCSINLVGADISKILFQYQNLKLVFPVEIINDEKKRDVITGTYEALLANFNKNGYKDSYEKLDVEYQDYKNRKIRLFNIILPHWWNCYGYHKEWIFIWTFSLLFLFTILTFIRFESLNKSVEQNGAYYVPNIPSHHKIILIYPFMARLWYSFLYTSNVFFQITLNIENMNFKRFSVIYIILVYAVGILCVGYIANFVLQK